MNRKKTVLGLFLAALMVSAAACGTASPSPISRSKEKAFKGWELYSWQDQQGSWAYSLLEGTNRNKTSEEIHAHPMGMDELRKAIAGLAIGEEVYWIESVMDSDGNWDFYPLPSADIVIGLQEYASSEDVTINAFQ